VELLIRDRLDCFERGMMLVSKLTAGKTYLCRAPGSRVNAGRADVSVQEFAGPHPAGLPGLHIHRLEPVSRNRTVWTIGAQDVIALGELFTHGKLPVERIVSLAGPAAKKPRLLRTRTGARLADLVANELVDGEIRVVSGSVLGGREAGGEVHGFLGRYHNQISCLREGNQRRMFGWLMPGFDRFSSIPAFASRLLPGRKLDLDTDQNGEPRPMVPIGMYERVMPMDIMAPFLLRALAVKDLERAEKLGALELAEDDLALCSFVCPGKTDWGAALRENLDLIEKEG
jgi:Na+-transporting NADH:ubiquinone oxidoreductase subunit A